MKNLISMTDFVLEQRKIHQGDFEDLSDLYFRYANFLKEPLELGMFVPCDEEGNVLNEFDYLVDIDKHTEWFEAKERVLFGGFRYNSPGYVTDGIFKFNEEYLNGKTIEDLVKYNLQLTPTALKQLGL